MTPVSVPPVERTFSFIFGRAVPREASASCVELTACDIRHIEDAAQPRGEWREGESF